MSSHLTPPLSVAFSLIIRRASNAHVEIRHPASLHSLLLVIFLAVAPAQGARWASALIQSIRTADFHETGKCAFNVSCRRNHDPFMLSPAAKLAVRQASIDGAGRQQLVDPFRTCAASCRYHDD
jgi:hypothetical protein